MIIEWEESKALDPAMLEVIGAEMSQYVRRLSLISNPKEQVDFQTVSLSSFQMKWMKVVSAKPTSAAEDPSQLPKHVVEIRTIDAIYNYVVYDYKRQWEVLSAQDNIR